MTPAEVEEDDEKDVLDYEAPPPLPCQPPPTLTTSNVNEFQDREYTNLKDIKRQPQVYFFENCLANKKIHPISCQVQLMDLLWLL